MNRPEVEAAARRCEYWLARADWFAAHGFDVLAGLSREIAGEWARKAWDQLETVK